MVLLQPAAGSISVHSQDPETVSLEVFAPVSKGALKQCSAVGNAILKEESRNKRRILSSKCQARHSTNLKLAMLALDILSYNAVVCVLKASFATNTPKKAKS